MRYVMHALEVCVYAMFQTQIGSIMVILKEPFLWLFPYFIH